MKINDFQKTSMIDHLDFIYGVYQCEEGYRICARLYNTDEWQDCQAFYENLSGFGNANLWITYPTREKATAIAIEVGVTVAGLVAV